VAALTGGSRAGSPAAHGWCRAVGAAAGLSLFPPLSGAPLSAGRVPVDAFAIWWAVEDLNL